jgi:ribonuclease P protein component
VLAKANRITRGADYKAIVRRGTRVVMPNTVTYVRAGESVSSARFGFIVGKSVGIANRRNLVRRRLKAVAYEMVGQLKPGVDIVIRALPASADAPWVTLHEEIYRAVSKGTLRS